MKMTKVVEKILYYILNVIIILVKHDYTDTHHDVI